MNYQGRKACKRENVRRKGAVKATPQAMKMAVDVGKVGVRCKLMLIY